jgi:hypothetical protein
MGNFNEDLRTFGLRALRRTLRVQVAPQDVVRFIGPGAVLRGRALGSLSGCQPSTLKDDSA